MAEQLDTISSHLFHSIAFSQVAKSTCTALCTALCSEESICELYQRVCVEQPSLVPVIEAFIGDVLRDLSARKADC